MKNLLALFLLLGALSLNAQTKDYSDLLSLFVDEKFEKCLRKAEDYTLSDKTKAAPLPYLFMSRCFYEMSKRDEFKETYPKANSDCFKYISKYAQMAKKKPDEARMEEFQDYLNELRKFGISEAEDRIGKGKVSNAKFYFDAMADIDPKDVGALIMYAYCLEFAKDKKSTLSFDKAKELLTKGEASTDQEVQKDFLKYALIFYSTKLSEKGSNDAALEWMNLGDSYFKGDAEYKAAKSLIGG
jgi:hypothetical protein